MIFTIIIIRSAIGSYRYEAIDKWTRQLNSLNKAVIGKLKD